MNVVTIDFDIIMEPSISFYNNMVDYRSKQEVVTKDNDDEVDFLRTYRRVKKHIYYAVAWCVLIIISVLLSI